MVTAKEARGIARRMLGENKRLFIRSYLAYIGLTVGVALLSLLFLNRPLVSSFWTFASMFLLIPLSLGILHIHNLVYYRRRCQAGNLFDFFKNYGVALKALGVSYIFSMLLSAALTPVMLLCVSPLILGGEIVGGNALVSSSITAVILAAVAAVILALLAQSFVTACYFIVLRNRAIGFGRLLGSSFKIGGRYLWRFFLLQLSFFGWILLCCAPAIAATFFYAALLTAGSFGAALPVLIIGMFICGIALFVVSAYMNAASTVFFNVAIDEYEQLYPDFAHPPVPPFHFPEGGPVDRYSGPAAGQPGPVDRYAGPAAGQQGPIQVPEQAGAPEPQAPENAEPPQATAEQQPDAEPVEKVEAEIIEPQDNGLCDVILISPGVGRMLVSMIICELTGMEHEQARELVENAPKAICTGIPREEAREIAGRLTDAGAKVELR